MKSVSIIIPVYNEEKVLKKLYDRLFKVINNLKEYKFEILFINDGSDDNTTQILGEIRNLDKRVSYINLSRNFGKEIAMIAGFDYIIGDCAIVMDADLQHPPELIPKMLYYWEEGYDDVYAKRKDRKKESFIKRTLSKFYYNKAVVEEQLKNFNGSIYYFGYILYANGKTTCVWKDGKLISYYDPTKNSSLSAKGFYIDNDENIFMFRDIEKYYDDKKEKEILSLSPFTAAKIIFIQKRYNPHSRPAQESY